MDTSSSTFSRYLPVSSDATEWGWNVLGAGRQLIGPGEVYPSRGHPETYQFKQSGKRNLQEFQLVYLVHGEGVFKSQSCLKTPVKAGNALLLFPGEWHQYSPNPATGWQEYWVGFEGREAGRIMSHFFSPSKPIWFCSRTDELLRLFDQLLYWIRQPRYGSEQILASHLPMLLAFLQAEGAHGKRQVNEESELVFRAKTQLLQNLSDRTDLEQLSHELGTSYSHFRRMFKSHTGYSPRQYENMIKLNRARDMLFYRGSTVSSTAEELGFSSVFYFSRAFRKAFGLSPQQWVQEQRKS